MAAGNKSHHAKPEFSKTPSSALTKLVLFYSFATHGILIRDTRRQT